MHIITRNATARQLEAAIAQNHKDLFFLDARIKNGVTHQQDGLCWTYTEQEGAGTILFPALSDNIAPLNTMMDFYQQHQGKNIGCWSLQPAATAHLDVLLLARGFQPGWQPCWMVLDLQTINTSYLSPEGLHIAPDNETPLHTITALPYADNNSNGSTGLQHEDPAQVQRFVATLNGTIVAQTLLLFGGGVAGIYNVGVVPEARGKGIGKAIVNAACLYARENGYHYATLNANPMGRPVYEQLGFQWIGDGLTWWITDDRLQSRPPDAAETALAEAVGKGDMAALAAFAVADLNKPLCNGMQLLELAVHCRQPASAEWLISHGATCSALDAWNLGWKDRAAALLAENPAEINRLYGNFQYTLLHAAVDKNDIALAQLALSAGPNLQITDAIHQSNALGWANYLERTTIEAMIKAYQSAQGF
ncbi:Predicted acetyltransferase, GNAT superfamily [Chitinophaga eiseniae]|uniref:Predicted acetyltransferase, GNAT superfamily n=1 Tax=Chitinophaga eiseniae TaxID=634771 RepID=A0A1T4LYI4_9BACT|nr:GNAT family N-acetyltransferase [Chitinophaga eiseniae]SJZ59588.1 Predicted acetyltransferase, GNAT superfamily [Chitinophaga eiseniae]